MKQMVSVRSNAYYVHDELSKNSPLRPELELVIIHTDGKHYTPSGKDLKGVPVFKEIRMLVSPAMLTTLITELQLHQQKSEAMRKNADQLNALIKHITTTDNEQ